MNIIKSASGTGSTLGASFGSIDHNHSIPAHFHTMGAGATLNITSSGAHTTAISHDHAAFNTASAGTHNHAISDPAHTHGVTDPTHTHAILQGQVGSYVNDPSNPPSQIVGHVQGGTAASVPMGTNAVATGIVVNAATTGVTVTAGQGAHVHTIDVPTFSGNSASTGAHTHTSGDIAGSIGLVTGGVNGNAAMTSGTNNPPGFTLRAFIRYQ